MKTRLPWVLAFISLALACSDDKKPPRDDDAIAPEVTAPALPNGEAATAYAPVTFTATGTAPLTWSVTVGALPNGMTLDPATGVYGGTPIAHGTFAFTVTATNSAGADSVEVTHVIANLPYDAVALLSGNRLAGFNARYPGGMETAYEIAGITPGDQLVAVDYRPRTGVLHAVGVNTTDETVSVYVLNYSYGYGGRISVPGQFQTGGGTVVPFADGKWDIDVHPYNDRIRIINDAAQNFRLEAIVGNAVDDNNGTGASVANINTDGPVNGATIQGAAYSNNSGIATVTTLYTVSTITDSLYIQEQSGGAQILPVALSRGLDDVSGFDIRTGSNTAVNNTPVSSGAGLAVAKLTGETGQHLVSIDLVSGAVTTVGTFPVTDIVSMAAVSGAPRPVVVLLGGGTQFQRLDASGVAVPAQSFIGVEAGETIVGIDYRPLSGRLYALGINHSNDTGTLYGVDVFTGAVIPIGAAGGVAYYNPGGVIYDLPDPVLYSYSFDFDANDYTFRVVINSGLNFRIRLNNGAPVDGNLGGAPVANTNPDGPLNGLPVGSFATLDLAGSNTDGDISDGAATIYVLDASTDNLCIMRTPITGMVSDCKTVTLGGSPLDFTTAARGFDLDPTLLTAAPGEALASGTGYAAITVGGVSSIYAIDLPTAVATLVTPLPASSIEDMVVGRITP